MSLIGKITLPSMQRCVAMFRGTRIIKSADACFVALHRAFENAGYDISLNGEELVLRRLSTAGIRVDTLFDVGANHGDWTAAALKWFPGSQLHAFELIPETAKSLKSRYAGTANVTVNEAGLSDKDGKVSAWIISGSDVLATCVEGFAESFHKANSKKCEARVVSGDNYCRQHGIDRIGFLKVDVEGFEGKVIEGFRHMFEQRAIDLMQFEYGYVNIETKFLLHDFYRHFRAVGMLVGKLYPNGVHFRDYRHRDEDFIGPNYIAVREDRRDIIEILQIK
jgi:FkbM family methyltransferase